MNLIVCFVHFKTFFFKDGLTKIFPIMLLYKNIYNYYCFIMNITISSTNSNN